MVNNEFIKLLLAGLLSGGMLSTLFGYVIHRDRVKTEQMIRSQFETNMAIFQSRRVWKEESVEELLGPMIMQLDRTRRAFDRWKDKNLYLEAKIIREGNIVIRDLLLTKGHLIPPELLNDAGQLVEHYDVWLEEFEERRKSENPDLSTEFIYAGPKGFPFPRKAEKNFRDKFDTYWSELYGNELQ